jgi:Uma2 family endonuclease
MPIRTESGLKLTYEDYVKIPEDGRRHEIIDGRHIVNPAPRPRHQVILGRLYAALLPLQESGRAEVLFSPIDVHLTETDIVQPDLIAIAHKSRHLIGELKIEGPPELVVEVLSPATRRLDRGAKRALYESAGAREYWILEPEEKTLAQHNLVGGRYTETVHGSGEVVSTAFPEMSVDLAVIFAG